MEIKLPEFPVAHAMAPQSLGAAGVSECHGVACGLACASSEDLPNRLRQTLNAMQVDTGDTQWQNLLDQAAMVTVEQLAAGEFGLRLWLPDDDQPLSERAQCLANWCQGLLAGLAEAGRTDLDGLSTDAQEGLVDVEKISRIRREEVQAGDGQPEEEERAFTELVEFVRIAALLLFQELNPAVRQAMEDAAGEGSTLAPAPETRH